jgi:phage tail sheath gpL-like
MTIDASAVARVVGIETQFKDLRAGGVLFLPQRIAVIAQGRSSATYALTKFQITSAPQAGARYGYGSPIHLIARELLPENGDGVGTIPVTIYPLEDGYDAVAAAGTITPSGTQTKKAAYRVRIGGILSEAFVIDVSATVAARCAAITAAINAVLHMPMVATDNTTSVGLVAKWAGESSNAIVVEVLGEALGTTFAIIQPTGGLVNPSVDDALDLVGNVWESMFLNALNSDDEEALDALQTFGEGRWGELVRKPFIAFVGNTDEDEADATAVTSTRSDDKVNCQLVGPGSVNMPFVVAARQLARIAKLANNNPPHDYGSQRATGLIPGDDSVQWDYTTRDTAVKAGCSTIEVKDGVVNISDVVTMYRPIGEPNPRIATSSTSSSCSRSSSISTCSSRTMSGTARRSSPTISRP